MAGIGQIPGLILMYGSERIGYAGVKFRGFSREIAGYYFYANSPENGVAYKNTSDSIYPTLEEAKDACTEYVKANLKR